MLIGNERNPASGAVTFIALQGGYKMIGWFTRGSSAVMAAIAGAQHREVVYTYWRTPAGRAVTIIACIGGGDMVC